MYLLFKKKKNLFLQTYVLPPLDMDFLPSRVEAEIGTTLELPLAVFGYLPGGTGRFMFADCRHLHFTIQIIDRSIFQDVTGEQIGQ